jgi:hypothetical protein
MKKYFDLRNIIIFLLLLIIIITILNPKNILFNRTVDVIVIDSIPYAMYDTILIDNVIKIKIPVDTMEILKIHFNKKIVSNVLNSTNNNESNVLIDTTSQNSNIEKTFEATIKKEIIKDTLYLPEERKNKLYFGINSQVDGPNFVNGLGVGILYQTKKDKIIKLGTGVNNWVTNGTTGRLTPYIDAGIYWKIKIKG